MRNYSENQDWAAEGGRGFWSWHASSLYLLALGAYLSYAFINFTVVRPTLERLGELQGQIAALETDIRDLGAKRGAVAAANTLMGQLVDQQKKLTSARSTLEEIVALNERLSRQADRAAWAVAVADTLTSLQDNVLDTAKDAAQSLITIEDVLGRLNSDQDATYDANCALDAIDRLRNRLSETQSKTQQAHADLDDVNEIFARLDFESETNQTAQESLLALVDIKDLADRQSLSVGRAYRTMQEMVDLQGWLLLADTAYLPRARQVVVEWSQLQQALSQAGNQTRAAQETADQLLNLADDLNCRGAMAHDAQVSLEDLIGIRQRLDSQRDIDLSARRMEQLFELKDRMIARTGDLALATENLELIVDIYNQLNGMGQSFARMRSTIGEILAFEPTFNRAMKALQPLIELGNLRHMSAPELRQVIRQMDQQRKLEWSSTETFVPTARAESPAADGVRAE